MNMEDFEKTSSNAVELTPKQKSCMKSFIVVAVLTVLGGLWPFVSYYELPASTKLFTLFLTVLTACGVALIGLSVKKAVYRTYGFGLLIALQVYSLIRTYLNRSYILNLIVPILAIITFVVLLRNHLTNGKLNTLCSFFIVITAIAEPLLKLIMGSTGLLSSLSLNSILSFIATMAQSFLWIILLKDTLTSHTVIADSRGEMKRDPRGFAYFIVLLFVLYILMIIPISSYSGGSSNSEPWKKLGVSKKEYMEVYHYIDKNMIR